MCLREKLHNVMKREGKHGKDSPFTVNLFSRRARAAFTMIIMFNGKEHGWEI